MLRIHCIWLCVINILSFIIRRTVLNFCILIWVYALLKIMQYIERSLVGTQGCPVENRFLHAYSLLLHIHDITLYTATSKNLSTNTVSDLSWKLCKLEDAQASFLLESIGSMRQRMRSFLYHTLSWLCRTRSLFSPKQGVIFKIYHLKSYSLIENPLYKVPYILIFVQRQFDPYSEGVSFKEALMGVTK